MLAFEANVKKCATVVFQKWEGVHHPRPTSKAGGFGVMKAFLFYIPIVTLESSLVVLGHGISILNH